MDQSVATSPVSAGLEPAPQPARNHQARLASTLGIIGLVLVAGVVALATNTLITALTTPDFMPDDITDDPFVATCLACALPFILGCVGLVFGIGAVRKVRAFGERRVAVRGLVFGIVNFVLPLAIGIVFFNFDLASAACGGG
jgi:hypothetical protein